MQTDGSGKGVVNILAADKLMQSPRLYATFLLWMLSELFEALPEVGDLDKPKLVFFFDEAHLLFADAPKVLIERIELVVRLVRSQGVGVFCAKARATGIAAGAGASFVLKATATGAEVVAGMTRMRPSSSGIVARRSLIYPTLSGSLVRRSLTASVSVWRSTRTPASSARPWPASSRNWPKP
jgi:hypothetical protein